MNEIWKDIKGYEGFYQVSSLGNIKSLGNSFRKKEKLLKQHFNTQGYYHVLLCGKIKPRASVIHRIVAKAFIENPQNKPEVNHINGNKIDNRLENLEWCTADENRQHAYSLGLKCEGEKHGRSKLKNSDICKIIDLLNQGIKQHVIASTFNVSHPTISRIKTGKSYNCVNKLI